MRSGMHWLLMGVLGLGLCATTAGAQQVVLMPHAGDAVLGAARITAQREVHEALQNEGLAVTEAPETSCTQAHCAPALLEELGAELAVIAAVWRSEEGAQVHVTMVDAAGNRFSGVARIEGADTAGAARGALLDARGLQLLGPGPWVRIEGTPTGAQVEIDGRFVGTLPYRGALGAGDHQLLVKAPGHAPDKRPLAVPLDAASMVRVELELRPEGGVAAASAGPTGPVDAAPAVAPSDRASPWNFILGSALVVGGLAVALVEPVQALAKDGDCVDATCDRVYDFGSQSALQMALGGALAGAGVTLMLWRPLRMQGPGVALQGDF